MRARDFKGFLERRPFSAFRVHLCSGQFVDVMRPDSGMVAGSTIAVGIRPNRKGIAQGGIAAYDIIHVVKVTFLKGSAKRSPNDPAPCTCSPSA